MVSHQSKIAQFLLHALVPVLCSMILGFIVFGTDIFTRSNPAFQFVYTPVIASLFYFLLVSGNPRNAYAGLFVLFVLTLFMMHSPSAVYIERDIFYFAAIAGSVYLFFNYFNKSSPANAFTDAVTLAGLYAVAYVVTSGIHLAIVRSFFTVAPTENAVGMATIASFFGVFIGFAVGGGITLADNFFGRIDASNRHAVQF